MIIKHIPSGLFPHFDSALERRPYFVRAGEELRFGCRLDGSEASSVWMEITDPMGTCRIPGQYHSVNDRGQRYFHFTHHTKENDNTFTYRFVTSDQEVSKDYECPVLREITLYPEISASENVTYLTFRTDTQEYRLEIQRVPCIRIILTSYLTVKIDSEQRNTKYFDVQSECFSLRSSDGSEILRIDPALTLMVDEMGRPHNIRLHIEFPGSAVYGLGEKFDAVNQLGKKPLNYVVEQFATQNEKTYIPVPFMFTDAGVSFLQKTSFPSSFDYFNQSIEGRVSLDLFAVTPQNGVLYDAVV